MVQSSVAVAYWLVMLPILKGKEILPLWWWRNDVSCYNFPGGTLIENKPPPHL